MNAVPDSPSIGNDFLTQITAIVEKNLANEQFGVSELADEMNMSRSNLLRRVKKETKLSVSQLISQVRLKRGMELLRKSALNVSEVSHQVGFGSTSYFIKCFREYYGYPPGEVGKREAAGMSPAEDRIPPGSPMSIGTNRKRNFVILGFAGLIVVLAVGFFTYDKVPFSGSPSLEKSIAVLPFKNDSNDSTNVYLINGLMESTLTKLQQIKDLKVISRTSAERYRNSSKSVPEIGKELNVNYFVEGSGQKMGDRIVLNIQLIEASSDKHLWARQYRREAKDIFQLQQEIAKNIAEEIQAIITPEEEKRIQKKPTDDLEAYDLFLKGRDMFYHGTVGDNLDRAIPFYKKAIEKDKEFALAYADLAMVYYYIDVFHADKKYGAVIDDCADKALLYDPKLGESLVAKALSYMLKKQYELAVPFLEKALEYNPNSGLAIDYLSETYNLHIPNTAKYLKYALKGVRLDVGSKDSVTTSYKYLQLSNALIQTGFIEEALQYINKSLGYNSRNPFSGYLKVFILFAKDRNLEQTRALLMKELNKDTTRFDILLHIGGVCYAMRDYESAYRYYNRFIEIKETQHLDFFRNEYLKIAFVLSKTGHEEKSKEFLRGFKEYADNDQTIYKHLNQALYDSYQGDAEKAIEHLELFSKEDNFQYWILFLEGEPMADPVKDLPRFKEVMSTIKSKFWDTNRRIRTDLEEEGLL